MTREILFRGFHKDENGSETIYIDGQAIKGKWVYGDLTQVPREKCNIIITEYKKLSNDLWEQIPYIVMPETVGQFSGLEDKNGKKIFEDDVYTHGDRNITYTAVWQDTGLKGKQNKSTSYAGLEYWKDRIEVIGTKFDKEVEI